MARLRRWRYLPAAVVALWGLTTTTTAAQSSSSSSGGSSSFSVKCWRVETSSSKLSIARAAVDDACPVSVDVADLTAPFAPGDDVPAIWTVTLKSAGDSTNALVMPLPPPLTTNAGSATPAQISATYVRSCESVATCDPASVAATSSVVRTSNFSAPGEPLSFSALQAVKFDREGVFPIAAFVSVRDALDSGVAYVFAAYATVTIKAAAARAPTRSEGVVRCRMTRQSALNATLDADASVSESSNCELRVALAPLQVVRPGGATPVQWVATLDRRDDADIHLPSPIPPLQIEDGGDAYEIVASYVKLCADAPGASCDEYTSLDALAGFAAAGPASFSPTSGNVTFMSAPVTLATAGRHPAMLHMVVAGPARRYDFVYYFELLATPAEAATTAYKPDAATSYCWDVLADATRADVNSSSVAAEANASACPYVSTLSMPAMPPAANEPFNLSWSLSANPNYSALASPLATPVNLSTVYDAASKTYVSLPALNVYACGNGTACTPFSPDKMLLRALPARSLLTDGDATTIRADGLKFANEGNYTILVHCVFPNGASRVDTAVYGALRVARAAAPPASAGATPEASKSHTVAYVVVTVVCVVAVAVVVFGAIWFRRRHQRQRMEKMVQFGLFGAPAARTGQGTVLHTTESRGSFPSGESGRGSFSFLRVQASQPSPMGFETPREGSLSYDPYHRPSFQDMSLAESSLSFAFTDNERPSTMSNLTNDDTKGVDV